jgi:hypothetical protein
MNDFAATAVIGSPLPCFVKDVHRPKNRPGDKLRRNSALSVSTRDEAQSWIMALSSVTSRELWLEGNRLACVHDRSMLCKQPTRWSSLSTHPPAVKMINFSRTRIRWLAVNTAPLCYPLADTERPTRHRSCRPARLQPDSIRPSCSEVPQCRTGHGGRGRDARNCSCGGNHYQGRLIPSSLVSDLVEINVPVEQRPNDG